MNVKITAVATAKPRLRFDQKDLLVLLKRKRLLSRRESVLYAQFLNDSSIQSRSFAINRFDDFFEDNQDRLIQRYQKEASGLSTSSVKQCLRLAGKRAKDVDCIVASTCTGYLCPGLTSYVMERSGLRRDVFALDIVGMGCGGASPAILAAHDYLASRRGKNAVVLATEICSSALYWKDDPEIILTNSIFGDGSAACFMTGGDRAPGFRILDFVSEILPQHRDKLRLKTEDSKLRNQITAKVPQIAGRLTRNIVNQLLAKNRLKKEHIKFWALHPGGRKVVEQVQKALSLTAGDLQYSRDVLKNNGNMSSPTALYVLKAIFESGGPKKGDYAVFASFGAGFSAYATLMRYE